MKPNVIPFPASPSPWVIEAATVKGATPDSVMVETQSGLVNAGVAFGYLVAPAAGDRVLVSRSPRECYVITVLERPSNQDMAIEFPRNVRLKAPSGLMEIASGKDLNLIAAEEARFTSTRMHITGGELAITSETLSACTRHVEAHSNSVRIISDTIDTVARRISQRVDTLMRWVEGVETLHIGSLIQTVRKALITHSEQTVMTAKGDMRIDAERIHMG